MHVDVQLNQQSVRTAKIRLLYDPFVPKLPQEKLKQVLR